MLGSCSPWDYSPSPGELWEMGALSAWCISQKWNCYITALGSGTTTHCRSNFITIFHLLYALRIISRVYKLLP